MLFIHRGKFILFEPNPEILEEFRKRTEQFNNIHVQPVACGEEEKKAIEYIDEHKSAASSLLNNTEILQEEFKFLGNSHGVPVRVVKLEDWVSQHQLSIPSLIKIDVQGYEGEVIAGGKQIIKKAKYIWVELNFKPLYESGSLFSSVYKILSNLGFELVDCVDLIRSKKDDSLLYMDGIFRKRENL